MNGFVPGSIAVDPDRGTVNTSVEIDGKRVHARVCEEALANVSHESTMDSIDLLDMADRLSSRIAEAVRRKYLAGAVEDDGWVLIAGDDLH